MNFIISDKCWVYSLLKFHKVSSDSNSVCNSCILHWQGLYCQCFPLYSDTRVRKKSGFVNKGTWKLQLNHSAHYAWFHSELTNTVTFQWAMLESSETQLNIPLPDLMFEPFPWQQECDPAASIPGIRPGWLSGWSTVCMCRCLCDAFVCVHCCIRVFSARVCDKLQITGSTMSWKEWWLATVETQSKQRHLTFGCPSSQSYYSPIV